MKPGHVHILRDSLFLCLAPLILWVMGLAVLGFAVSAEAQQTDSPAKAGAVAPAGDVPSKTRPCSTEAIGEAAARKVAPDLRGCGLAKVTPGLLLFYKIVPKLSEVAAPDRAGTIVKQAPEAGAPLGGGDRLSLVVSSGPAAQADSASSAVSETVAAGSASASDSSKADSSSAQASRFETSVAAPLGESATAESALDDPAVSDAAASMMSGTGAQNPDSGPDSGPVSGPESGPVSGKNAPSLTLPALPPWAYIAGGGAALLALLAAGGMFRGKKPSSRSHGAAPAVTCQLEFGAVQVTNLEGRATHDVTIIGERQKDGPA